jgi:hypothetical protein
MSFYGKPIYVEKNRFSFRPAAYGALLHQGHLLVVDHERSGKLFYPGGGVGLGDAIQEHVVARLKREAGLDVEVVHLVHFKESFFYYDPLDQAYQNLSFFYLCRLAGAGPLPSPGPYQWVELQPLEASDFHSFGGEVLAAVKAAVATGAVDSPAPTTP